MGTMAPAGQGDWFVHARSLNSGGWFDEFGEVLVICKSGSAIPDLDDTEQLDDRSGPNTGGSDEAASTFVVRSGADGYRWGC